MVQVCKAAETQEELEEAFQVRRKVFIEEQEVPESEEWDEYDKTALHAICLVEGDVVGTGRAVFSDEEARIGRIAVLKQYRGQGIGSAIAGFLLDEAREMGKKRVLANAQVRALAFYEKLGFRPYGEVFMEAGIEHIGTVLEMGDD